MSVETLTGDRKIDALAEVAGNAGSTVLLAEGNSSQVASTVGERSAEAGVSLLLEAIVRLYGDKFLEMVVVEEISEEVMKIMQERRITDRASLRKIALDGYEGEVGGANGNVY